MFAHLTEAGGLVHPGAMDQQRVEEHGVPLLHLQVGPGELGVKVPHAVVHLVHPTLSTEREREGMGGRGHLGMQQDSLVWCWWVWWSGDPHPNKTPTPSTSPPA